MCVHEGGHGQQSFTGLVVLLEHVGGPVAYLLDLGYHPYHLYQDHLEMSGGRVVKAQHASYLSAWKGRRKGSGALGPVAYLLDLGYHLYHHHLGHLWSTGGRMWKAQHGS